MNRKVVAIVAVSLAIGALLSPSAVAWDQNTVYIDTVPPLPKEEVAALIRAQGNCGDDYYMEGLSYEAANLDTDGDLEIAARIDGGVHLGQFFVFDRDPAGKYRLVAERVWKVDTSDLHGLVKIGGKRLFTLVTRTGGTGLDRFDVHLCYLERGEFVEAWEGTLQERSMMAGPESFFARMGGYRIDVDGLLLYAWETSHQLEQDGVSPKGDIRTASTIYSFDGSAFIPRLLGSGTTSRSPDGRFTIASSVDENAGRYQVSLYNTSDNSVAATYEIVGLDFGFLWATDSSKVCASYSGREWVSFSVIDARSKALLETPPVIEVIEKMKAAGAMLDYSLRDWRADPYMFPVEWAPDNDRLLVFYEWTDTEGNRQNGFFVYDVQQKTISRVMQNPPAEGEHVPFSRPDNFRW